MKALSIRQPWAWLIAAGHKDIENRSWNTKFRGKFLIHAGKKTDELAWWSTLTGSYIQQFMNHYKELSKTGYEGLGAIIGEAEIVDVVTESDSIWFNGPKGFVIKNAKLFDKPIAWKGQLKFFEVAL